MKGWFAVVFVVALLGLAVGAMAAGTAAAPAKAKTYTISGTVKAVGTDSLTVDRGPLHLPKDRVVTVSVSSSTTYTVGTAAGSLADVKVGAKVIVRLTAKLQGNKATAVAVRVKAPKAKSTASSTPAKSK